MGREGISLDINGVGVLLMGIVLGWFLVFAVRRYRVQWGAFSLFMSIVFGLGLLGWLYVKDLLAWYGIGIFVGFFANLVIRVVGVTVGGPLGQGLLEISSIHEGPEPQEEPRRGPQP